MTASTCDEGDFNARVVIFTGDSCSDLQCLANSDDSCSVTWSSVPFQDYYILVQGEGPEDIGAFGLSLTSTSAPNNDECPAALGPVPLDGSVVQGSTVSATVDPAADTCEVAVTGPGVWFFVEGDGTGLVASTCRGSKFDTKISVYEGGCPVDGFNDLLCIASDDDFCGIQSVVTWDSQPGKIYYILVSGFLETTGDFELRVAKIQDVI